MAIDILTGNRELSPRQQSWLRALVKAQSLGTAPRGLGNGVYTVAGSVGAVYTVRRLDPHALHFSCDCKAGEAGRPCYHAAATAALPAEAALRTVHRDRQAGRPSLRNERIA
jgi:hypothetical protein